MVGPHLATAPAQPSWRPRGARCLEIWGAAGVGPNFRIVGGGDRLCRRRGGVHSWLAEREVVMKNMTCVMEVRR